MLVILKIPVVYLCAVVWWAIRAEPLPLEGAGRLVPVSPTPPECGWRRSGRACSAAALCRAAAVAAAGRSGSRPPRLGCAYERRLRHDPVQPLVGDRHGRGAPRDDLHLRQLPGVVYRPVRIIPFAIIIALIAARMSARQQRLAGIAVAFGVVCWTVGMTIAVVTENPLY